MMRIIAFRSPRSLTSSINGWNYDYTDFADRSWWRATLPLLTEAVSAKFA
jgi:hypothetical protein